LGEKQIRQGNAGDLHYLGAQLVVTRLESEIQIESGLKNETNEKRQQKRLSQAQEKVAEQGKRVPKLYEDWQRIKQTGVTFIRWLRGHEKTASILVPRDSSGERPPVATYYVVTRIVDRRFLWCF